MTSEYLKCRADLNFEVDVGSNGTIGFDLVGSYFIRKTNRFQMRLKNLTKSFIFKFIAVNCIYTLYNEDPSQVTSYNLTILGYIGL